MSVLLPSEGQARILSKTVDTGVEVITATLAHGHSHSLPLEQEEKKAADAERHQWGGPHHCLWPCILGHIPAKTQHCGTTTAIYSPPTGMERKAAGLAPTVTHLSPTTSWQGREGGVPLPHPLGFPQLP